MEIAERIRVLLKRWHPDVCREPDAHQRTVLLLRAKAILLNPAARAEYDKARSRTDAEASSGWRHWSQKAQQEAESQVNLTLDELLSQLVQFLGAASAVVARAAADAAPQVQSAVIAGASMSRSSEGREARAVIGAIIGFILGLPAGGIGALPAAAIGWYVGYWMPELGAGVLLFGLGLVLVVGVLFCGIVSSL